MPERIPQFDSLQEGNVERVKTDPIDLYLEQLDTGEEFKEITPQAADLSFMSKEQWAETLWALFESNPPSGSISRRAAEIGSA
ncbi:MAG: hypothetical protein HY422_00955 [Candidatus Komeilibacteria bacterium]|nr:hypothetical protein [Candidatus Komeilibacteria bacterium]